MKVDRAKMKPVYIQEELHRKLKAICAERGFYMEDLIDSIVFFFLNREEEAEAEQKQTEEIIHLEDLTKREKI